jgi:hypothetical protein
MYSIFLPFSPFSVLWLLTFYSWLPENNLKLKYLLLIQRDFQTENLKWSIFRPTNVSITYSTIAHIKTRLSVKNSLSNTPTLSTALDANDCNSTVLVPPLVGIYTASSIRAWKFPQFCNWWLTMMRQYGDLILCGSSSVLYFRKP